jgi:dihydrofolate reductase
MQLKMPVVFLENAAVCCKFIRKRQAKLKFIMRKLILEEWVSLDGYAADKNGALNFFPATEANKYSDLDQLKFMDSIDTILLGRITYDLFADFWPAATTDTEIIADKLNSTQKIVFSNTLKKAPWGKWPDAQIISGDAIAEVKKLKEKEGKNIVLWGSISLAQSLIKENLIDEYHLQICPTIIGDGRPLFPNVDSYKSFKLVNFKKYDTGVMFLHYEP